MSTTAESTRTAPGRLVLVVGPSGAGKDTLIRAARDRLAARPDIVFARRTVTRPTSPDEDNDFCDEARFQALASSGRFALTWTAHGLSYGIPVEIENAVSEGRTVVCNVSRTIVERARRRYHSVLVVEVTAPAGVLAARLARRARASDGDLGRRIERSKEVETCPDATIPNDGPLAPACEAFLALLTSQSAAALEGSSP